MPTVAILGQEQRWYTLPVPPTPPLSPIFFGPVIRDFWATILEPTLLMTSSSNTTFFISKNQPIPPVLPKVQQPVAIQTLGQAPSEGINSYPGTPNSFGNIGFDRAPFGLLVVPGNGTLDVGGGVLYVIANGQVTIPFTSVNAGLNLVLNQNYFSSNSSGQITQISNTIATLPSSQSLTSGKTYNWSIVGQLLGCGRTSGALICNYTITINGVVYHGSLTSNLNPRQQPIIQLSLGVQLFGSVNGGLTATKLNQFQIQAYRPDFKK